MNECFDCENICRTCLANIENIERVSLYDEKIMLNDYQLHEALEACTSVHINYSERTSIYLCDKCFQLLETSFKFRVQCLSSAQKFNTLLRVQNFDTNSKIKNDIKLEICKSELKEQNNDSNLITIKNESIVPCKESTTVHECLSINVKIEDDYCTKSNDSEIYETQSNDDCFEDIDNDSLKNEVITEANDDCLENIDHNDSKNEVQISESIHEKTVYECTECNKVFKKAWMLENHKLFHGYNCKVCFKSFNTDDDLNKHAQEHAHLEHNQFVCKECGAEFNKKYSLVLHTRKRHTGEKPHLCSVCGRAFADERYLISHMRIHDGAKPYECNVCNAKFRQSSTLKSHLTTHTTEKNYICTLCGKKLAYKSTLRIHMLSHSGVKKYPCTICEKTFKVSSQLNRHMCIHSGEKKYKCLECGKAFGRSHHLTVHRRIHTGEKPHVCSVCGRGFTQLHVLRTHLKTHKD